MADTPTTTDDMDGGATRPSRKHLTEAQREQIARMLVYGAPYSVIAAAYRTTPERIRSLDRRNQHMQVLKEEASGNMLRPLVEGKYIQFSNLDRAFSILAGSDGLGSVDERVRRETAKWWITNTLPPPKQQHEHTQYGNVQHDVVLHVAEDEMRKFLPAITEMQERILATGGGHDWQRRIKVGPEALGAPIEITELDGPDTPLGGDGHDEEDTLA